MLYVITFTRPINEKRNEVENEVISVWDKSGIILIRNFLDQETIESLHQHAINKLKNKGADPGDHFRTTKIKKGHEGRGWAQRKAIREQSPALLAKVIESSKKLQQLIFGDISTTTEIQFNATYSPDIGHIHIDRPAGFLSSGEAKFIDSKLLQAMNRCSFQTAFYTGATPRSKGSTGFIPGSHRLFQFGINTINLYANEQIRDYLGKYMMHGDIPKDVAIVFQSSVLHRTGSNMSGQTRSVYV